MLSPFVIDVSVSEKKNCNNFFAKPWNFYFCAKKLFSASLKIFFSRRHLDDRWQHRCSLSRFASSQTILANAETSSFNQDQTRLVTVKDFSLSRQRCCVIFLRDLEAQAFVVLPLKKQLRYEFKVAQIIYVTLFGSCCIATLDRLSVCLSLGVGSLAQLEQALKNTSID